MSTGVLSTRHARAAAFAIVSVLCFAINDTITKEVAKSADVLPVLTLRAAFGALLIFIGCLIFKLKLQFELFYSPLLAAKTALFVCTIALFASALKQNTFVEFYSVYLFFLPIFTIALDRYTGSSRVKYSFKETVLSLSIMFVGSLVAYSAIGALPQEQELPLDFGNRIKATMLTISTSFFYSCYIAFDNYAGRKLNLDAITQNVPMLSTGCIILFFFGLTDMENLSKTINILYQPSSVISILFSAAFAVVGIVTLTRATKHDLASKIAPYDYFLIVYALFIERFYYHRPVSLIGYIGALIVLCGAALFSKAVGDKEIDNLS